MNVSSEAGAAAALTAIDGGLDTLANYEGEYGAMSARLQGIMDDLFSSRINASAANSRITDADIAAESVRLTSGGILSQMTNSVAATVNAQPGATLNLLSSNNIRAENGLKR